MNLIRRVPRALVAGLLVLAGASAVAAQTYVENGVQGAGNQPVIITVTPGSENDVIDTLRKHGHSVKSQHPSINGISADINGSDLADLAQHGAVTITRDHSVHLNAVTRKAAGTVGVSEINSNLPQPMDVSTLRLSLGLNAGGAGNLTSGINGTGVKVAVIDSGIAPSADFNNLIGFYDFTVLDKNGGPTNPAAYDDLGHGTHVAGLIASSGVSSKYMFQGIAPAARLAVLKVLDKNGAAKTSTVIAAIEFAEKLGVQVINLSLGHPITAPAKYDPLVQAVESAVRAGITVVIAAGNDGPGYASITSPSNAPSAITVGAADGKTTVTRADDYVPDFSSRGPTWYDGFAKPDVVAPGVNLFSDAAVGSTLVNSPTFPKLPATGTPVLLDLSGTSMAAAVATGVVALELDANAHQASVPLTPNAAKSILEYTAIKIANTNTLTQGAGQINAAGAVQLADSVNTAARTNTWWLTAGVTPTSTIGDAPYTWSQNIIWGTSILGGNFIYYKAAMFGDNIIWGTGVLSGNRLLSQSVRSGRIPAGMIWGKDVQVLRHNVVFQTDDDNIIWGTADIDNIIWGTAKNLEQFRVVGERVGDTIVWNNADGDNIIWGTMDADNIIWGTDDGDNIIWGTWAKDGDNIIWGTTADDNIIWGTSAAIDNIIWGTSAPSGLFKKLAGTNDDNIIWGTADDNIIWGTSDDNIIWGTDNGDNIVWGTDNGDNIIWGTAVTHGKAHVKGGGN